MNLTQKMHDSLVKTKQWPASKWFNACTWVITGIMLLVLIILLVVFASSLAETLPDSSVLTTNAVMQQNVIAAIAFVFLISLALAIFSMVINIYRRNKIKKGRA